MILFLKRMWSRLFWLFPINKTKFFFTSYEGKQFSCNPKYFYLYLKENFPYSNFDFIWEYNSFQKPSELSSIPCVKHNSLKYFFHLLTSKYIITNSGITACIALRKKQICINTWHGGGAYKKVGAAINSKINGTGQRALQIMSKQTTYFLSSSQKFSTVMAPSIMLNENKFLPIGMPRNDIFFNKNTITSLSNKVKTNLHLSLDTNILLYAPTFRGKTNHCTEMNITLDTQVVIYALQKKMGGNWVCLYRAHYHSPKNSFDNQVINVSNYPDMQELLCASDVLITDYSSCIWDYAFLSRPCFLFAPDLNSYKKERDFYTDISTWPAILSTSQDELIKNILLYDQKYFIQKNHDHLKSLGSYESGTACKQLLSSLHFTLNKG